MNMYTYYSRLKGTIRSQQREMDEIRHDLQEGKAKIMRDLSDLSIRSSQAKLKRMTAEIQSNPEQVKQIQEEYAEAVANDPRRQYEEMVAAQQQKQAAQLQQSRNVLAEKARVGGRW